jgi:hypothetical protein
MLAVGGAIQRSSLLRRTTLPRPRYRRLSRTTHASYFRTVIKRFITRLGNQRTDMPGGSRNTRANPSSESQEDISQPSRGSAKVCRLPVHVGLILADPENLRKVPRTKRKSARLQRQARRTRPRRLPSRRRNCNASSSPAKSRLWKP